MALGPQQMAVHRPTLFETSVDSTFQFDRSMSNASQMATIWDFDHRWSNRPMLGNSQIKMSRAGHAADTTVAILRGLGTFVPGCRSLYRLLARRTVHETGGALSASYCYSTWLRHLVHLHAGGLNTAPTVIAELGPGNSLGTGICALLTGGNRYLAFDVVRHVRPTDVEALFDELLALFTNRAPIPLSDEVGRKIRPRVPSCEFPSHILSDERLSCSLSVDRLQAIKRDLLGISSGEYDDSEFISYRAPWHLDELIKPDSVDFIFSQYVLEHVDDLPGTYAALYRWLRPGGVMSHNIDYHCHGLARDWNAHWRYNDLIWRMIRGNRPYLINRAANSDQLAMARESGFEVVSEFPLHGETGLNRKMLARRFIHVSDEDLRTVACLIQVKKPNGRIDG
jgi:SAM-dependent methyltransferase